MSDGPRRKRARLACVACNSRRVKCDVTECQPCSHCATNDVQCETRESRRGKHPRRPRVVQTTQASSRPLAITPPNSGVGSSTIQTSPQDHDEVAASHVLASLSGFHSSVNVNTSPITTPSQTNGQSFQQPSSRSRRDISDKPDDDGAVFLGESSSLRYVTDEPSTAAPSRSRPRLRHSVPNAAKADALIPHWEAERRRARVSSLQAEGTLSFPPKEVRHHLLKAYFLWFHPHFPVLDEPDVWNAHREGSLSALLLQAILFIGVIHCEESTLKELGWGSRHKVKYLFYSRAKDIYDAEYETRKLIVIQALFLLSFWRAGALLEKDVRHWLGAAIGLAQTKALHRFPAEDDGNASIRRRLWWAIYVRERQCSSALGLPNRIRDEDCDVGQLSGSDFQSAFDPSTSANIVEGYTAYVIEITKLAILMGRIVDAGYLPNRSLRPADRLALRERLLKWKQQLPSSMRLSNDTDDQPSFQASMLHLAYNNLLILLHRSAFIAQEETADANFTLQAAAQNSRIVEDLLSDGKMSHVQIHAITNLFNTLCIHVVHLRRSSGITKPIAEHRAKVCLLGLQELQRTWEVTNWVLQLFFQYLDRTTAARLNMKADAEGPSSTTVQDSGSSSQNRIPDQIIYDQLSAASTGDSRVEGEQQPGLIGDVEAAMTPWSWTTDEANQYLFSQIENGFAFGEGGILEWSPDEMIGAATSGFGQEESIALS